MRRLIALTVVAIAMSMLAACGNKGPLVMPSPQNAATVPVPPDTPAKPADTAEPVPPA